MIMDFVEINHSWGITLNPFGDGLSLCVQRGIPCENHTQVVSVHTTNTPDLATVKTVVEKMKEQLNKEINAFVDFMIALDNRWPLKENIGLLFLHDLLKRVADEAQLVWEERRG